MIARLALLALVLTAACGAAGPPEPFEDESDRDTGIAISGTAEIGISGGSF